MARRSNALKHGAFSEVLILPSEKKEDFDKLKADLMFECKPSGCSEENVVISIAKALWQERRLRLYEHVQSLRPRSRPGLLSDAEIREKLAATIINHQTPEEEEAVCKKFNIPWPPKTVQKTDDESLLELGELVTLDHLTKELDVEARLHCKIDRLIKRLFQLKAMKQMMGTADSVTLPVSGGPRLLGTPNSSEANDRPQV